MPHGVLGCRARLLLLPPGLQAQLVACCLLGARAGGAGGGCWQVGATHVSCCLAGPAGGAASALGTLVSLMLCTGEHVTNEYDTGAAGVGACSSSGVNLLRAGG